MQAVGCVRSWEKISRWIFRNFLAPLYFSAIFAVDEKNRVCILCDCCVPGTWYQSIFLFDPKNFACSLLCTSPCSHGIARLTADSAGEELTCEHDAQCTAVSVSDRGGRGKEGPPNRTTNRRSTKIKVQRRLSSKGAGSLMKFLAFENLVLFSVGFCDSTSLVPRVGQSCTSPPKFAPRPFFITTTLPEGRESSSSRLLAACCCLLRYVRVA